MNISRLEFCATLDKEGVSEDMGRDVHPSFDNNICSDNPHTLHSKDHLPQSPPRLTLFSPIRSLEIKTYNANSSAQFAADSPDPYSIMSSSVTHTVSYHFLHLQAPEDEH